MKNGFSVPKSDNGTMNGFFVNFKAYGEQMVVLLHLHSHEALRMSAIGGVPAFRECSKDGFDGNVRVCRWTGVAGARP